MGTRWNICRPRTCRTLVGGRWNSCRPGRYSPYSCRRPLDSAVSLACVQNTCRARMHLHSSHNKSANTWFRNCGTCCKHAQQTAREALAPVQPIVPKELSLESIQTSYELLHKDKLYLRITAKQACMHVKCPSRTSQKGVICNLAFPSLPAFIYSSGLVGAPQCQHWSTPRLKTGY